MTEKQLKEARSEFAKLGGKARWQGVSLDKRSKQMKKLSKLAVQARKRKLALKNKSVV